MTDDLMFGLPAEELAAHSQVPFRLVPDVATLYAECAADILQEIRAGQEQQRPTRLILPVGPIGQYPLLVEQINRERLSLRHVWVFQMDEYLDWQARAVPEDHPNSFRGHFRRAFYDRLDPELRFPEDQWLCPLPGNVDLLDEIIARLGGIDACYGGIGIHGHIAFNEAPLSRWREVPAEEFKRSSARILQLAAETTVINGMQVAGGNFEAVPPMAATVGMGAILGARKLRLYCNRGEWQKAVLRRTLLMPPTVRYPATFCQEHPNCLVTADRESAQPPPQRPI
jgi:glucosamine-6-phosphate deaminase